MWAVKGHYFTPFYNWPYTYGLLFGIGLYARYLDDPDRFRAGYDDLLSSTGLADAAGLAGRFGIDVRATAFWASQPRRAAGPHRRLRAARLPGSRSRSLVSLTPLTVPFDVMVVDPDLLWRVDAMNAFDGVMVKDVVTVLGATDELTPGHPAVVLLGPAASVESDDQLPVLRSMFPEVRVVSVAAPRLTPARPTRRRRRGPIPRPRTPAPTSIRVRPIRRRRPARDSASSGRSDERSAHDRPTIGPTIGPMSRVPRPIRPTVQPI